ncbi:MAG TPA: universal stress protein [Candidatus Nitrosotenuis sp.]|nr:universal stress protein [Candidatus Nitrosotenuis sp.]
MAGQILIPLDGSEPSESALPHALALARRLEAGLILLHVVPPSAYLAGELAVSPELQQREEEYAADYLQKVAARLEGMDVEWHVRRGDPAQAILDFAERQPVDLIVLSSRGRSGIPRWLFGSVAERVVRHAPVPVMVVHPGQATLGTRTAAAGAAGEV